MSKKKATMTLKDFHGGSIPSVLHLPSAPGVTVRSVDRGGFDRQMSWGNSVGRSDHRLCPASAGSARNLDEKIPFLSHSSHIGRHFDEDERKPLDGVSCPRRTASHESFHGQTNRVFEPKIDNLSGSRVGINASSPVNQISGGSTGSSYAGRVSEAHNPKLNSQILSGSCSYGSNYPIMVGSAGQASPGSFPNAWGIRKEIASMKEPASAAWSAPDAETKLAHASALEKVSSGRWNSKLHVHPPKDATGFGCSETEGEFYYSANNAYNKKTQNRLDMVSDSDYQDSMVMHTERILAVGGGIHGGVKEMSPTYERARSTTRVESYERNRSIDANGFQLLHPSAKPDGTEFQSILPPESSERPKLKLLPRSKPLESSGLPIDHKQRYEQASDCLSAEDFEVKILVESDITGPVFGNRALEQPKLNFKPRSQPMGQLEGNSEFKRWTDFGEGCPREMVLKTRRIGDDVSNYESQHHLRVKEGAQKADTSMHVTSARYSEKSENIPTDQRMAKYWSRRDHELDGERTDSHRRNRQNDNWRNGGDAEKHRNQQQKQLQDRPPSPETWRKPVEHARATSPAAPVRFGKAASAVELAQAFSKSVSNSTVADRLSGPRGVPGRSQMHFSRLMGPTPRPQINGY